MKADIKNRRFRINRLYKIIDKEWQSIVFKLNKSQELIYDLEKRYKRLIILKARQLGMSTYKLISWLDRALFYPNKNIVITAHNREKQQELFQKVKYAYQQMPESIRLEDWTIWKKPTTKYDNVNELYFGSNNSKIKVSLDSRSWTVTDMHITELAFRKDATAMMTGTLPSIPKSANVGIETTANGVWNYFHRLRTRYYWQDDVWELGFYCVFIPWFTDDEYRVKLYEDEEIKVPDEIAQINDLDVDDEQKKRYIEQWRSLGREVMQEFPSTPGEAFLSTGDPVFNLRKINESEELKYHQDERYKNLRIYKPWEWEVCFYWVDTSLWWWWDYSTIVVRNRQLDLLASYRGYIEPDVLCDIIDRLWELGYRGTIGIERNNTGLVTVKEAQKRERHLFLYREQTIDHITEKAKYKYWWTTSSKTRPIMISDLEKVVRTDELVEFDEREKIEMQTFIYDEKNRPDAIVWCHDDLIIADSICIQMTKR